MGVPVVRFGQGLIQAVVEVLVVREDDVAADIVELRGDLLAMVGLEGFGVAAWTYEALGSDIGGGEATGLLVGIQNQPRRSVLTPESVNAQRVW